MDDRTEGEMYAHSTGVSWLVRSTRTVHIHYLLCDKSDITITEQVNETYVCQNDRMMNYILSLVFDEMADSEIRIQILPDLSLPVWICHHFSCI